MDRTATVLPVGYLNCFVLKAGDIVILKRHLWLWLVFAHAGKLDRLGFNDDETHMSTDEIKIIDGMFNIAQGVRESPWDKVKVSLKCFIIGVGLKPLSLWSRFFGPEWN